MSAPRTRGRHRQGGIVLVSSLLLLLVVTILALSMFRSFGLDEKIAGNLREKQRAVSAAETAQQYAEYWLLQGTNASQAQACTAAPPAGSLGQVCTNVLNNFVTNGNVANVPWTINNVDVSVPYTPIDPTTNQPMIVNTAATIGSYYYSPRFYISVLGQAAGAVGTVYQIDAVGYGGTPNTVAVVESTYLLNSGVTCASCP